MVLFWNSTHTIMATTVIRFRCQKCSKVFSYGLKKKTKKQPIVLLPNLCKIVQTCCWNGEILLFILCIYHFFSGCTYISLCYIITEHVWHIFTWMLRFVHRHIVHAHTLYVLIYFSHFSKTCVYHSFWTAYHILPIYVCMYIYI